MDLSTVVAGIDLMNPLMPASGPLVGDDRKMLAIGRFGVGGLVSKTISTKGAVVPRPCIYGGRDFVMNAELWSEHGPDRWIDEFLPAVRSGSRVPLFLSAGYSAEDMAALIPRLDPFADAFEISTHYVGKDLSNIAATVRTIAKCTQKPFLLKMSPHIPDPVEFARMALDNGAAGIVAINSLGPTIKIDAASRRLLVENAQGEVWMSGPAIKPLALALVRRVKDALPECAVIGVGGVATAEDVLEFILAGADAVQLLSAAMLKGKDLYAKILADLPAVLDRAGFASIAEARASRLAPVYLRWEPRPPIFDLERCTKCGLCEKICPYFAIENRADKYPEVDAEECFGCGLCQSRCPVAAISGVY
jgi:dihydroorotate dehydrogenase (fumarate)